MYFSSVHSIYDDLDNFLVIVFFFRTTLNEFAQYFIKKVKSNYFFIAGIKHRRLAQTWGGGGFYRGVFTPIDPPLPTSEPSACGIKSPFGQFDEIFG